MTPTHIVDSVARSVTESFEDEGEGQVEMVAKMTEMVRV